MSDYYRGDDLATGPYEELVGIAVTEAQRRSIERALDFASINWASWSADDASALELIREAGRR